MSRDHWKRMYNFCKNILFLTIEKNEPLVQGKPGVLAHRHTQRLTDHCEFQSNMFLPFSAVAKDMCQKMLYFMQCMRMIHLLNLPLDQRLNVCINGHSIPYRDLIETSVHFGICVLLEIYGMGQIFIELTIDTIVSKLGMIEYTEINVFYIHQLEE